MEFFAEAVYIFDRIRVHDDFGLCLWVLKKIEF